MTYGSGRAGPLRRALLLAVAAGLAGCASVTTTPTPEPWTAVWEDVEEGLAFASLGRYRQAERAYLEALREAEAAGDPAQRAVCLYHLGDLYFTDPRLAPPARAEAVLHEALELWRSADATWPLAEAAILARLAAVKAERGDMDTAHALQDEADAIVRDALPADHRLADTSPGVVSSALHMHELWLLHRRMQAEP